MNQKKINETLRSNVAILSKHTDDELRMMPTATLTQLPSVEDVKHIISLIKSIVFSDYFHKRQPDEELRAYQIGVSMEELYRLLRQQIARGLQFCEECAESDVLCAGEELALKFIDALPEIKRLLYTDIQAMFDNDPAAATYGEVIFCYPVVNTMTHYRVAHKLHEMQVPVIPRIITEQAHSKTGIDIHPGAQIGEYFSIDHGTGVVIGETSIIGNHVTLYQGVTLGAKSFKYDEQGNMLNVPRHPIIEDNVTVYSNASILGRITIGHDSVIGGNIWLTHSVPPYSRILQSKAVDVSFQDGLGI
ncbi:MAG: serine acetyltransferase [Prevotella sp.]|nr:serine acetyltransferase [Prevotella sp.]